MISKERKVKSFVVIESPAIHYMAKTTTTEISKNHNYLNDKNYLNHLNERKPYHYYQGYLGKGFTAMEGD